MIVSKDKSQAHLTCYRSLNHCNPAPHRVVMQGLDEDKQYYIPELGLILHGDALMSVGIPINFDKCDFDTRVLHFEEK